MAVCSDHIVLINSDHEDDFNRSNSLMRTAMAHELGHILGLGHVGDYDSWDGLPPIMRPCFGAVPVASGLSQDDWGAANGLRDRSLGGFYNVTANSPFEDGVLKWGEQNTILAAYSGGVDGSLKYARMTGYDSTSAAFNTTRVADHQGHDIAGMKARANYRTVSSSDSGYVKVALRLNYGDYPSANDTCGYPDFKAWDGSGDRDLDQPRSSWNWYFESVDCIPVSSWSFCDTPEVGTTVEGDVQDMRVAVYNRMRTAQGYWTSVAIDRARALVRFS